MDGRSMFTQTCSHSVIHRSVFLIVCFFKAAVSFGSTFLVTKVFLYLYIQMPMLEHMQVLSSLD